MGGIGKTTLAQLVYNECSVKKHFDLKAWVCVSDNFDVLKLTKTILEEMSSSANDDSKNLNQLQNKLKEKMTGKKFLLVLDDVWEKNYAKWEVLSNALKFGAQGSKVIVTTCDYEVARVMVTEVIHSIKELSEEDCWSLFKKYAFRNLNLDACLEREVIGRQIVEKCKGLPLAIKAIGALLGSKLDVDEWDRVLRSELWDLPIEETGILPALGLSYKYLSPYLKRCFAYCSIFPKDYAFKKDKLILLWMAEGFLPQPKNKTMEEVGDDYFFALVSRSLFQKSDRNEYIMHDLVSDLAKFISKQFTLSMADDCPPEIVSNTRHLSFHKDFASLQEAKRFRTVLQLNLLRENIYETQFPLLMTSCLRLLSLTLQIDLTELPNSIDKLIHLRYLDISYTSVERLPDSICKLYNLQILNLSYCSNLVALPRDTHKLINLRHLDITGTLYLMEMPRHLDRLKSLRTLTEFAVGKDSGCGIGELKKLTNLLRGSLCIKNLQNVTSLTDANDLNLVDKKYLERLALEWNSREDNTEDTSERQIVVLASLQPHSNLKSLTIRGYDGKSFPDWVGQLPSLEKLEIRDCPQVESFTEGGLPSNLNEITIFGCDKLFANRMGWGLQKLQCLRSFEILDNANVVESFPNEGLLPTSLTHLHIGSFQKLKFLDNKGLQHLTALEELRIYNCPKLECMPEGGLPKSLSTLMIPFCPLLEEEWRRKGEEWRKIADVDAIHNPSKEQQVDVVQRHFMSQTFTHFHPTHSTHWYAENLVKEEEKEHGSNSVLGLRAQADQHKGALGIMYKISPEAKPLAYSCKDARTSFDIGGALWHSRLPLLREAYSGSRREALKLVETYAETLASRGLLTTAMEYLKVFGSHELSLELAILRDGIALYRTWYVCLKKKPGLCFENSQTQGVAVLNGAYQSNFGLVDAP
ncbi:putative disease resistance RPP13-like protein 1 [Corylus avellana]|uniref:putative disease resistance RPP13-like protein 1 n=1 Tax=Corylus avellana TaxID=13451 RepID=UPI00286D0D11|nr:putative disease resistance RPP13-like protein 1 [Corylus avellana]